MIKRQHLFAGIIFLVATVILTWPLVLHLPDSYPSTFTNIGGDPNMYISYMDLLGKKLENRLPVNLNQMLFYPQGTNLSAGYEGPIMLVVGVPVVLLTHNPVLAYNLILFLAFVLSCMACYFLVDYLTGSFYAAVIAGFSFGLSPYMLVRGLQHIDLLFLFAVPWLILTALQFVAQPGNKRALLLGLAVLVAALSAWYYLLAGLVFLGLVFLFNIQHFLEHKKSYAVAFAAVCVSVLLTAIPIILHRSDTAKSFADTVIDKTGAQPLNFFLPHPFTDVWHFVTDRVYRTFPSVYSEAYPYFESTSYFGLVGLIALAVLIFFRKKIKVPRAGLWITSTVLFTILAMGTYTYFGHWKVPLPFAVLHKIFPFDHLRAPNRFFVFAYASMTVVFGYFLAWLEQNAPSRRMLFLITTLIVSVLLSERIIYPYQLVNLPVSQFYRSLAADKSNYAIADLPIDYPGYSQYNYYQIFHNKPIISGEFFWTTYNSHTFDFIKSNSLLLNSARCNSELSDIHPADALRQLAQDNVRYVVVHNFILHDYKECPNLEVYIRKFFQGRKSVFSDGEITAYSTLDKLPQ